jgi:ferric-dicitrate binding protein FerR (iron transport regulator)
MAIPSNTIAPGGNKAILTLGNGQKVILDSAGNGTIAFQGNSRITKNDKGEIVYDATAQTNNFSEILFNTISTPNGGQYKVVLPDGTNVWLNAASSIRFPTKFVGKERAVAITGEVYFEVTKNASMPFKVKINEAEEIKVLGTHFNVMAYKEEKYTKATLLEGSIKIHNRDESILVKPGGQAILRNQGEIELVNNVNTDHIVAWKNGLFDFDNDDLPYIMRQLSRWYDVDIVYTDNVPEGHYAGSIRKQSNITEVLKMLELAGDVQFSIVGKKILVKGN